MGEIIYYSVNDKLRRISIILGLIVLFTLTMLFRITDWDNQITGFFYNPSLPLGSRFFLNHDEIVQFLYDNDTTFMILSCGIGLLLFFCGLFRKDKRDFVKYGAFVVLVAIIGPGVIANLIFKDCWGRPRPRETVVFGGSDPFYRIWDPAFLDGMDGKSFPSGHPCAALVAITIFFVFNHPEYFVKYFGEFKLWKVYVLKFIKYSSLLFSFFGGLVMGIARIAQGAHYASDVLWSYGFVYLTAALLYYVVFNIPKWEKGQITNIV